MSQRTEYSKEKRQHFRPEMHVFVANRNAFYMQELFQAAIRNFVRLGSQTTCLISAKISSPLERLYKENLCYNVEFKRCYLLQELNVQWNSPRSLRKKSMGRLEGT